LPVMQDVPHKVGILLKFQQLQIQSLLQLIHVMLVVLEHQHVVNN